MTAKQINNLTNLELLQAYKAKRRCFKSENTYVKLYREILIRKLIPDICVFALHIAVQHMQMGEGWDEFDEIIDEIIDVEKSHSNKI